VWLLTEIVAGVGGGIVTIGAGVLGLLRTLQFGTFDDTMAQTARNFVARERCFHQQTTQPNTRAA